MKRYIARIKEITREFGNHYNKHLMMIERNLPDLIKRLEETKNRENIHILHPAYDFEQEIRTVARSGITTEEKLNLTGTFFALQLLYINRQAIDLLQMDSRKVSDDRSTVYRKFMINAGNNFRLPTRCYLEILFNIFSRDESYPHYVILGVGTKSDQDDIDIGIIDDGDGDRKAFNQLIARVSQEFFKYATSFHFHLSEHIGTQYYSASIPEYKKELENKIGDYVIISEMLSAAVITGEQQLYNQFRKEITARYFYRPGEDNRYHEGYLRGIIGEIQSLLAKPMNQTSIHLKEDGLRIIKNTIAAQKTIYCIDEVNAWQILDRLKYSNPQRLKEYYQLERSLTFFEIFRYLYQLFSAQQEEIQLEHTALRNVRRVSKVLGYTDIGITSAETNLLVHYYEHVQNARQTTPVLINDIKEHLNTISKFRSFMMPEDPGNMTLEFIEQFRFFVGTSFWDDVLDNLRQDAVLIKFINDFKSLAARQRDRVIKLYFQWFKYDLYSFVKLLGILGNNRQSIEIFEELNDYLLERITSIPDIVRSIAHLFNRFPTLINSYLALNNDDNLHLFSHLIENKRYESEISDLIGDLDHLINLHRSSSSFFKHFFLRVLNKYPESITLLKNDDGLDKYADGLYSDIESMPSFDEKKEKLGDYYDLEMLRVGIKTLNGASPGVSNVEFTNFSDNYIRTLFDLCRREVDTQTQGRIITEDLFAVFAAGGHGREQGYDDDFDMIAILNSDNPQILKYCNHIVIKMNREIAKRGTIPHHRFADHFGSYVINFNRLVDFLKQPHPDHFIEQSLLLGARMVVGSHHIEKEFNDHIIRALIFRKNTEYISAMIEEMRKRHEHYKNPEPAAGISIKETAGGLRDIEMLMLIFKARFRVKTPVNLKVFRSVRKVENELKADLKKLTRAFDFLKQLRDVYRLTNGASDLIIPETLDNTTRIMGYESKQELFETFIETTAAVTKIINRFLHNLKGR
ncbi:hypothetical protein A2Y85_05740 [candidate division WOR-3 bacterium RBG_13_43_14]|uniref:PII-uridylyltransferase/Glutamine-synthetase adenylyltransferase domain-containing protein n=1 Tax=candidate division WOR-3 bacterium RBG_13_43_14 TaxID=1802590 RepID=A0A1F4U393_UNCW3|nr:MAG: hypothetical protein A2Y85_05740 [candidate division WOR-3 bacterium RBG_13_43_14]